MKILTPLLLSCKKGNLKNGIYTLQDSLYFYTILQVIADNFSSEQLRNRVFELSSNGGNEVHFTKTQTNKK